MKYLFFILSSLISIIASAQYNQSDIYKYIDLYKEKAIQEQHRTGIPACIKLAQGIYETGAGTSELCNNANNHFGIKCKNTWQGKKYTYTDDAPDECFRSYDQWEQSYEDHSDFLRNNKRYATLFTYDMTDYKSWCHGLKKAGYATNPQYAPRLIKIIEDYNLNSYTIAALNRNTLVDNNSIASAAYVPAVESNTMAAYKESISSDTFNISEGYYKMTKLHGLSGFYAKKGDHLLEYCVKNRIRYSRILEINELEDAPLPYDMFIYLDRKNNKGSRPETIVREGESLHYIAQREGINVSVLRALNLLLPEEIPAVGQTLQLKNIATTKPLLAGEVKASIPTNVSQENYRVEESPKDKSSYISKEEIEDTNQKFNKEQNKTIEEVVSKPIPIHNEENVKETPRNEADNSNNSMDKSTAESDVDMMKRRFDQMIYGTSQEYNSGSKVESKEYLKVNNNTAATSNNNSESRQINKPASEVKNNSFTNQNTSGNTQERLRNHMNNRDKNPTGFKPKATGLEGNTPSYSTTRAPSATPKASNTKKQSGKADKNKKTETKTSKKEIKGKAKKTEPNSKNKKEQASSKNKQTKPTKNKKK